MNVHQMGYAALTIGAAMCFLAVALSIIWQKVDTRMGEVEPVQGESFAEADARWQALRRVRDALRWLGLICLYGGSGVSLLALMAIGAEGAGWL